MKLTGITSVIIATTALFLSSCAREDRFNVVSYDQETKTIFNISVARNTKTKTKSFTKTTKSEVIGHNDIETKIVPDYSAEKRAFYHMRDENGVPQGYDLIWRGVEITTGAQREHRYEVLKKQAEEKGLANDVKFYLEFFKYGCPPHGGFGIGVDRLTMLLLGLPIKEAMFLFRGPARLTP